MTHPQYVTNYTCKGQEEEHSSWNTPWKAKNAHMSFVSGHSSMAWQAAIFCVLYIQSRIPKTNPQLVHSILVVPFVQLLIIILAYFTSLTRVKDYWHHPGDVIGK